MRIGRRRVQEERAGDPVAGAEATLIEGLRREAGRSPWGTTASRAGSTSCAPTREVATNSEGVVITRARARLDGSSCRSHASFTVPKYSG